MFHLPDMGVARAPLAAQGYALVRGTEDGFTASDHGTMIAGILLGWCPKAVLVSYRVASGADPDLTSTARFLEAFDRILAFVRCNSGYRHVVTVSQATNNLGALQLERFHGQIRALANAGALLVCGAGNDGEREVVKYPAAWPEPICVTACDRTGSRSGFSSVLNEADCCALGKDVTGMGADGQAMTGSGTSYAAPQVAGMAGMIWRAGMTAEDVWRAIKGACVDVGPGGRDPYYGWGIVDPVQLTAAQAAEGEAGMDYIKDTGLDWPRGRVKRAVTDHIQIHHTVGNYGTPERWKKLHHKHITEKGHKGVPYSYLITADGEIYLGRGHEYCHGGVTGSKTIDASGVDANCRSIAIALNGDMRDGDKPTAAQLASLTRLVEDLMRMYKLTADQVLGHNEVTVYKNGKPTGTYATLCPCMDMAAFRASLSGAAGAPAPAPVEPDPEPEPEEAEPDYPRLCEYGGATYANLRSGPGTDHKKIGTFAAGQRAILLDTSGDWAEIITHETTPMQRGFVTAKHVRG